MLPLLAAGLACVVLSTRRPWQDRNQQLIALVCLGLTAWLWAVDLWGPRSLPAGQWRALERTAGVSVALAMVAGGADPRLVLRSAAWTGLAICGLVVIAWFWQGVPPPGQTKTAFGFGGVNVCLTIAVPAMLAWGAWLVARHVHGQRTWWGDWAVLAIGTVLAATISWVLERRGPVAAIAAVPGFLLMRWWWRRSRTSLIVGGVLLAVAGTWWLVAYGRDPELVSRRTLRLSLYPAAAKLAWYGMPWGLGDYGGLHLQWFRDPDAQLATQTEWYLHLHNEVLDLVVAGGFLALLAVVALAVLVVRRVGSCTDPALAGASGVLVATVAVHALTDNSYGQPAGTLWCAAVLGLLLTLPVRPTTPWPLPEPRWWTLLLGPIAAWGVLQAAPMALLPADAPLAEHERAYSHRLHPETIHAELVRRIGGSPSKTLPSLRGELASAIQRLGPSGSLPWLYALSLRLTDGDASERLHFLAIYLDVHPLEARAYVELQNLLSERPELASLVPGPVLRRTALVAGLASKSTATNPQPPRTVAGLADLWAEVVWHIRRGRDPKEFQSRLEALAAAPIRDARVDSLLEAAASYSAMVSGSARGDKDAANQGAENLRTRWPWLVPLPNGVRAREPDAPALR